MNKVFISGRLFNRLYKGLCLVSFSIAGFVLPPSIAFAALPDSTVPGVDISSDINQKSSVALGDWNKDGHMDVVVGNGAFGAPQTNKLYLSNGTGGFDSGTVIDGDGDADSTTGVVVADLNGDTWLDLVVGNFSASEPNKLYMGDGEGGFCASVAIGPDTDNTKSVALGDVDGDGDMDLVVGNTGAFGTNQPNRLYLFDAGIGPLCDAGFDGGTAIGSDTDMTDSLALGDVDGDGDMDLVAGNNSSLADRVRNKLYLNTLGVFSVGVNIGTVGNDINQTKSVVLWDINNDNHLDIVEGNVGTNKLYLNNGSGVFASGTAIGSDSDVTYSVALGDVDGDGYMDLVAATGTSQPNKLYLNNGVGGFASGTGIGSDIGFTNSVALGDVSGDGYLDLVVGNRITTNKLYATDHTIPVITRVGDTTVSLELGSTYTDAGATAVDNIDGTITSSIVADTSAVNVNAVGTYTVTYNVSDAAGNAATQVTRTVNITADVTVPVITRVGDATVSLELGSTYTDAGATAVDNIDGTITSSIVADTSAVNVNAVGTYTVTYNVSDAAGNAATQVTRTVQVVPIAITLTSPDDISVNAVGYLTNVDIGTATARGGDGDITVSASRVGPFQSGSHEIVWTATDSVGSIETATQMIKVHPLANFCTNMLTTEGSKPEAHIWLSGHAAVYPVMIPFEVSGTATEGDDYAVTQSGTITIEEGTFGTINLNIVADGDAESEETVQIILGDLVNAARGVASAQTWSIVEGNLPPNAMLMMSQDGVIGNTLVADGGTVTVSVIITDANGGDQHTVDWMDALGLPNAVVDTSGQALSFSAAEQGAITIFVDVSDGMDSITVSSSAVVLVTAPTLAFDADTDGDGISDAAEGYGDSDGDGMPDYQDNIAASNVVPMDNGFMQTEACTLVSLGAASLVMGDNNVTVSESELVALGMVVDAGYDYPSHLVDFAVTGADLGHTYKVVMPLSQPLPNGAVYRKYLGENIGWQMFVENADNAVATASALKGACPHTGSEAYTPGLTAGDNCLQLLIQDGGPNDSDGAVNGTTTDTGGIAVKFIGTPSKNSEVILRQTVITANAVDSTVVTVTAYDDQGVGLEHMSVTGSMPLMGVVVSDFVEQGSGVYTATVTGGMTAGSGPVTVVIDNGEMSVMLLSARLRLASVSVSKSGGGGCTVASDGSADASLLLLLIIAGLLLARRRYQFN